MADLVKIYRDDEANAVFIIKDKVGSRFTNTLFAFACEDEQGNETGCIAVRNLAKAEGSEDFLEFFSIPFENFVDKNNQPYGSELHEVINELNSVFVHTGAGGLPPTITSSTAITVTDGDPVHYTLIAERGTGYYWNNIPNGLAIKNGDDRKLIGTVADGVGLYNIEMNAVNYYGADQKTLALTVAPPGYNNTKSTLFENFQYIDAAATTSNPFYRPANGSGASDAWSIAFWFKPTSLDSTQAILYFGSWTDLNGKILLNYNGFLERLELTYGSSLDGITLVTDNFAINSDTWQHIMITYDGGTTGDTAEDPSDYYSRFKTYIDGAPASLTGSIAGNGWGTEMAYDYFRFGRNGILGDYLKTANIDEIGLWDSDQSSNIASIYNGGTTHDLSLLVPAPEHYWRMGDGDTYPTLSDNINSLDFNMVSMTPNNIVNDVPN